MIQRIQSVYLLLGSIAALAPVYFRNWIVPAAGSPVIDSTVQIVAVLTALVALFVIFQYKNRDRQYQLILGVQILTLILIVATISVLYLRGNLPGVEGTPASTPLILILLLPFVAYILFLLARRAVKKDIEKVKSMDRLR